ncbi:MAG: glycosyltransferase family 2 protein [Candidatus Omnitrophota bacterium]
MNNYTLLSVLIPTYNEEEMIAKAIKRTLDAVPGAEIVVVDDGSTDQTISVVEGLNLPAVKIIKTSENKGKGAAVKEGVKYISRPITVQIDADLQFLPEEIPDLIEPISKGSSDIVFGSRYLNPKTIERDSVSPIKRMASLVTSVLISCLCFKRYTDVFAGMKAWKSQVMRDIDLKIDNFGYEAEIAIMAKKKRYRIIELPISYKKRALGESKIRIARDTFKVLKAIFRTVVFRA